MKSSSFSFFLFLLVVYVYGAPVKDARLLQNHEVNTVTQQEGLSQLPKNTKEVSSQIVVNCADSQDDAVLPICAENVVSILDVRATPTNAHVPTGTVTASKITTPKPTWSEHQHDHHQEHEHQDNPPAGEGDGNDKDSGSDSPERDFARMPISDGRKRASVLGVIIAIALSSIFAYLLYAYAASVRIVVASLLNLLPLSRFPSVPSTLTKPLAPLKSFFSFLAQHFSPNIAQSSRRRRRQRALARFRARQASRKGTGFRPAPDALRAWAVEAGSPLGATYERGLGLLGSRTSNPEYDAAYEGDEDDVLDLGADEDFMIGAGPGSQQSWRPAVASISRAGAQAPRTSALIFSVGADDYEDDVGFATDEELPLAPTPHRYGAAGPVRAYGSTS